MIRTKEYQADQGFRTLNKHDNHMGLMAMNALATLT
jgi:hypothetical protein